MNLFILSFDPKEIAEFMMDKHISKIILEAVQMLCSALRILEADDEEIDATVYKMAHKNHPVTIWCRNSKENFEWTLELIECMHNEWKWRYGHKEEKKHKAYLMAEYVKSKIPDGNKFPQTGLTQFALAMPVEYKTDDVVRSYRDYYMSPEKQRIATWNKKRSKPEWYTRNLNI